MPCQARILFLASSRQFFLFSPSSFPLFSFLFFFPPTLSSSVPWFVSSLQSSFCVSLSPIVNLAIDNPGYPVFFFPLPTFSLSNKTKKRPFLPSSSARLTSHPTDKANSPLRHNGRHRQATHCRPGCCLPAHEAKELRC